MQFSTQLLIINCSATMFMVGLIWMVQVVHYPLFANIGEENFTEYQKQHQTRISFIVGPAMLIEAVSSTLLLWYQPFGVETWQIYLGLALLGVIWFSTAFIQVPCHERLTRGFETRVHARLVGSNWLRTLAWSMRGVLSCWMLACLLRAGLN